MPADPNCPNFALNFGILAGFVFNYSYVHKSSWQFKGVPTFDLVIMGRPLDKFAWAQVEKMDNRRWKCRYCGIQYNGAATRIRNHLSGQGNDISECKDVPPNIKQEAGDKRSRLSAAVQAKGKKTRRKSPVEMESDHIGPSDIALNQNQTLVLSVDEVNKNTNIQETPDINPVARDVAVADTDVDKRGHETICDNAAGTTVSDYDITGLKELFNFSDLPSLVPSHEFIGEEEFAVTSRDAVVSVPPTVLPDLPQITLPSFMEGIDLGLSIGMNERSNHVPDHGIEATPSVVSSGAASNIIVSRRQTENSKKRVRGGSEEDVTYAFLKFLMCVNNDSPIAPSEFVKHPLFREFMRSLDRHGVPSSLLGGDSAPLHKSSLIIKYEVEEHMLMVITKSWNTTGRTFMVFNLNTRSNRENKSNPMIVIAIYCPKGIIFVEALHSDMGLANLIDGSFYKESMKRHSPRLHIDEKVQLLSHLGESICRWDRSFAKCELSHTDGYIAPLSLDDHLCLRNEINELCNMLSCWTEWAENLSDMAMKIHDILYPVGGIWDCNSSFKEDKRLEIFFSVVQYHKEDNHLLKYHKIRIEEIISGSKFWSECWKLALILKCVMKIADVMDTIVPTAGYLGMALDKVDHIIRSCGLEQGEDALQFWEKLKLELEQRTGGSMLAASYLNPVYFLQLLQNDSELPTEKLKNALKGFAQRQGFDLQKIDEQVERYADVFRCIPPNIHLQDHHPVKLWEEYGSLLTGLHKCAIMLLSRPLNCLGKQVKEHLYHLEGSDDCVIRLNLRMMQHFEHLGDDIYKPLDLSQLSFENFKKYMVIKDPEHVQPNQGLPIPLLRHVKRETDNEHILI